MRRSLLLLWLLLPASCRLNPECFGANECGDGLACYRGSCVEPDRVPDTGLHRDAGSFTYNFREDIRPILEARCVSCHATIPVNAPRALVTWEDTQVNAFTGRPVHVEMALRVADALRPMPPQGQPALTPEEIRILQVWSSEGAPEGPGGGLLDVGFRDGGPRDGSPRDLGPDVGFPDLGPRDPLAGVGAPMALRGGFGVVESPLWRPMQNDFLFCDLTSMAGGVLHRLILPNDFRIFRANVGTPAAIRMDPQGRLVWTQFEQQRVVRLNAQDQIEVVADNWLGLNFNSPNDLDIAANGTVYFTDSDYGLEGRPREIPFQGVFRVTATGSVTPEWRGAVSPVVGPNGVQLSLDERLLYVSDTRANNVMVFDVAADGTLGEPRIFADDAPMADGLSLDVEGNLYVAIAAGVQIYAPDGELWGTLPIGADLDATNTGFGGPDRRYLLITTLNGVVMGVQMNIPGAPE